MTLPMVVTLQPIVEQSTLLTGTNKLYRLQAFIYANAFNSTVGTLGLFRTYTKINSGGVRGIVLRAIARKQITPLIQSLNLTQPD